MSMRRTVEGSGFGARLKSLRDGRMTQEQLAREAELTTAGIAKIEQGVTEPHWLTVIALARALGCTPNDFLPDDSDLKKKRR